MLMIYSSQTKVDDIRVFKEEMGSKFEMSDLGKLNYYLGIEVIQTKDGVMLKQERYAMKILEEAGMSECNAVHIPMEPGLKLCKGAEEATINEREFRRNWLSSILDSYQTRSCSVCWSVKLLNA